MGSFALEVYRLAAGVLAPVAAYRLARAAADDPALQSRRHERDGDVPAAEGETWLHAASVGEVNAVAPLARALLAEDPARRIVFTTVTATGAAEVDRRFGAERRIRHLFAPLDTRGRVRRWLDRTRPAGLVLVETELWPELIAQCRARGVPVAIVSARLSCKAFARYSRLRALFRPALGSVDMVLCQTRRDRDHFGALGVPSARIFVTGNLKLDVPKLPPVSDAVKAWRVAWDGRPAWVAGSTHAGEEPMLAAAHRRIRERFGDALLICVPRHPERADDALRALEKSGVACVKIDRFGSVPGADAVVVDRVGVLAGLYQVADLCVVCGSLVPGIGGHNLVEPALAGRPVITGPWTDSQREMVEGLREAGALIEVDGAETLAGTVIRLLEHPDRRRSLGQCAGGWAESQHGTLDRTLGQLGPWLRRRIPIRD